MEKLNVSGLSCPIPVLKTKKAVDQGIQELEITGDSKVSQENVSKFAVSQGFQVETVSNKPDNWILIIKK
jgi:Predicted redox protein, regulator of disulfide bond formation